MNMERTLDFFDRMEHEYRRQLLHAAFGLLILFFPFMGLKVLLFLSFCVLSGLAFLPEDSRICRYLYKKPLPGSREMLTDNINEGLRSAKHLATAVFVLLLISSLLELTPYSFPLYVIAEAIAISTFGTSAANFIRHRKKLENIRSRPWRLDRQESHLLPSSIVLLGVGIITACFAGIWLVHWQGTDVSYNMLFFLAVIGSITGALFESIPSDIDNNLSVPLGSGMTMWLFSSFGYSVPAKEMFFALIFSLILGYLAYRAKIADLSALFSASLLGVLIIVFSELFWFILLLTFFILGGGFTKYKYGFKKSIGLAQSKGGVRSYENVFSNSTAALVLAILYGIYPQHAELIIYAYLGTVATATGDTLASEIGTTARSQPIMITTLKPTVAGVDGAVTVLGEAAALFGSIVIGLLPVLFGKVDDAFLVVTVTTLGGFIGTNFDSLLGATFQKNGLLTNSGVNFVATFAGAAVSALIYLVVA